MKHWACSAFRPGNTRRGTFVVCPELAISPVSVRDFIAVLSAPPTFLLFHTSESTRFASSSNTGSTSDLAHAPDESRVFVKCVFGYWRSAQIGFLEQAERRYQPPLAGAEFHENIELLVTSRDKPTSWTPLCTPTAVCTAHVASTGLEEVENSSLFVEWSADGKCRR